MCASMTLDEIRDRGLILLECVSGSRAYGLHTPQSDTDIKGVFLLPKEDFYGLNYIPQISNESNDIVFYELGRFMELLSLNNPNILELLNSPEAVVKYKHPLLDRINSVDILSKLCKKTFGKFALSQIKKARGLNKKILNPIDKERKTILSFCYVNYQNGSLPLQKYLELKAWRQEDCGLVNIPNMRDVYGLYHGAGYKGIIRSKESNEVALSSIPKGREQEAILYFNKDGYSTYCKDYKEYWSWVASRNEARYQSTQSHGKNYDAKNMMHTFRLLEMAIEIGRDQQINVWRNDRDFLLKVKSGAFSYEELLNMASRKQEEMEVVFGNSNLPDRPDVELIKRLTYELREALYKDLK